MIYMLSVDYLSDISDLSDLSVDDLSDVCQMPNASGLSLNPDNTGGGAGVGISARFACSRSSHGCAGAAPGLIKPGLRCDCAQRVRSHVRRFCRFRKIKRRRER